ncbi:uncharacterized protein MONBRDRAFT_1225, partial [Monosiga brevicollis MX1]
VTPARIFFFTGGSAFNDASRELAKIYAHVSYCLPVSDDGGSTAEILRILGGPAIGDIRSRLLRLAREDTPEQRAVLSLLQHRLPHVTAEAREQWLAIVEGSHELWIGVSDAYKHIIRSFLLQFNSSILQASGPPFDFRGASIGNCFFTGARKFFHSLKSAVHLWKSVAGIPSVTKVLPVINTHHTLTLGCALTNGTQVFGQNEISHPGTQVDKAVGTDSRLQSPIERLFYVNQWDQARLQLLLLLFLAMDQEVAEQLRGADMIVYSMGSLYTSIGASLVVGGVGPTIAQRPCRKVLLLNSRNDRESGDIPASGYVTEIA